MKKLLLCGLMVILAGGLSVQARVLYYDDFSGSSSAPLNGTAPDIDAFGGKKWAANASYKADGSVTGTQISATLPFTPQTGRLYELTASGVNAISGDWFGVGFATGQGVSPYSGGGYRFLSTPVIGNAWFLLRAKTVTAYESQSLLGPGTISGVNAGFWRNANVDIRIYLDTRPTLWAVTWQIRYVGDPTFTTLRTASYTANPTIAALGFAMNAGNTDRVDSILLKEYESDAGSFAPSPQSGAANVDPSATLSWNKVAGATGYKLYMAANEPNFIGVNPLLVSQTTESRVTVNPPITLAMSKTYYWYVDAVADPNVKGPVWFFDTVLAIPNILTNPANTEVFVDQSAQFSGQVSSILAPSIAWYKTGNATPLGTVTLGTAPVSNGRYTLTLVNLGSNHYETTLTFGSLTVADHSSSYYFTVTNSYGSKTSTAGQLGIKRLLAWYQFEQNANDSANSNHGTVVGSMNYSSGIVTTGGQQYAADPNGSNYFQLSTTAYPKKGLGNGMVAGTISAWVKLDGFAAGQTTAYIAGNQNQNDNTAYMFYVGSGTTPTLNFRMYTGTANQVVVSAAMPGASIVGDGKWHLLSATYQEGSTVRMYLDGLPIGTPYDLITGIPYTDWDLPVLLGANGNKGNPNGFWKGKLDDLRIYNYPLDGLSIADMYLAGYPNARLCLLNYASEFDTTGPQGIPDCAVDIYDFIDLANNWLSCGIYPDCQ